MTPVKHGKINYSHLSKRELCLASVDKDCELPLLSALLHTCGTVVRRGSETELKLVSENEYLYPLVSALLNKLFGLKSSTLSAAPPQNGAGTNKKKAAGYLGAVLEQHDKNGETSSDNTAENKKAQGQRVRAESSGAAVFKEGRGVIVRERALEVLSTAKIIEVDSAGRIVGMISGIEPSLLKGKNAGAAYLRGAYLGAGSLSTAGGWHLEMSLASSALAEDLQRLIGDFSLSCHGFERKDKHVVYIKRVEDICDFLAVIGARKTMLELTEISAENKTRKDMNGRNNLELSNMDRTIDAGVRQAQAIRLIMQNAPDFLDAKLSGVAQLRMSDEAMTYEEIASRLGVSKGSVDRKSVV